MLQVQGGASQQGADRKPSRLSLPQPSVSDTAAALESEEAIQQCWKAKRYAVKFGPPPCVFLEYEDENAKRRVRAVKLSRIKPGTDVDRLTRKVIRSFPRKLETASVKYDQVRNLVAKLVQYASEQHLQLLKGQAGVDGALTSPGAWPPSSPGVPPLLPTLSPKVGADGTSLARSDAVHSSIVSMMSSQDRLSHSGSDADEASRAANGQHPSTSRGMGLQGSADTDYDLDNALDELDREISGLGPSSSAPSASGYRTMNSGPLVHPHLSDMSDALPLSRDASFCIVDRSVSSSTSPQHRTGSGSVNSSPLASSSSAGALRPVGKGFEPSKSRMAPPADDALVLELEFSGDVDLNKATEIELKLAKQKMDEDFQRNQIKPGDPRYQYDKQVEFGPPVARNDWDESDDEDDNDDDDEPVAPAPARPAPGGGVTDSAHGSDGGTSSKSSNGPMDDSAHNTLKKKADVQQQSDSLDWP